MGYAPDWNKGSMKKAGATPVKHGVTSRELFHGAKAVQKFADGGGVMGDMSRADMMYEPAPKTDELNIRGQAVGKYEGNDEIVKYRMNMTDDVGGKSLRYKDNPDAQPMPEKRPYDSVDAILKDKGSSSKKAQDKELVGDVVKAVKEANKPKATAVKASAPKAASPKSPGPGDSFSDDSRSPNQVDEPYRPIHNEADGSYEQLRSPAKRMIKPSPYRRNSGATSEQAEDPPKTKSGSLSETLRALREGMATTVRK